MRTGVATGTPSQHSTLEHVSCSRGPQCYTTRAVQVNVSSPGNHFMPLISRSDMSPERYHQFRSSHQAISSALSRLDAELHVLEAPGSMAAARRLFVTHLLMNVAVIRMLYAQGAHSHSQLMSAIDSITKAVQNNRLRDFGTVDPIVAVRYTSV